MYAFRLLLLALLKVKRNVSLGEQPGASSVCQSTRNNKAILLCPNVFSWNFMYISALNKTLNGRDRFGHLGVNEIIILKWVFNTRDVIM
jgi:hypothetical protein